MYKSNGKMKALIFVVLAAILLAITACSRSDTPENSADDQTTESNSDNANADLEQADEGAQKTDKTQLKAELKVLTEWGGVFTEQFNNLFADFNKQYPNIKATLLEQTTADLPALIAAGEAPDLMIAGNLATNLTKDNMIEDLRPYIETDPDVGPEIFYDFAYNRSVAPTGEVWALPWHVDPNYVLMYHRDILEQYGYEEIPEMNSLQEFGDFLADFWVVRNGEQEMTTFAPHEIMGHGEASLTTLSFLNGADASTYFDPATNNVTFNDPLIVETLEWMMNFKREHYDEDRLSRLQATLPEGMSRFTAKKQLMEPTVTLSLRAHYEADPTIEFALMPEASFWVSGWSWALTTVGKPENKDAAWELLKWMTSTKEGAESQLKHFGWISGIKDDPYLREVAETDPVFKAAYDVLQKAKKVRPYIPVQWEDEFFNKWPDVLSGTLEPKAFLDHMDNYIQTLLDEYLAQTQ
jgi:ABC-type glycerol-3-phosphate transport system substrate-binding protein